MKILRIIFLFSILSAQNTMETAFVQYYSNNKDFISGIPMLATERSGKPHLIVSYNENKLPIFVVHISAFQDTLNREVLTYDSKSVLKKKALYNQDALLEKIIHYGEDELWSQAFRLTILQPRSKEYFLDQQTQYFLDKTGKTQYIIFTTIDGFSYGKIDFRYDHLGLIKEEIWRELPNNKTVRRFIYVTHAPSDVTQLWEFDRNDSLVSHIALQMAPADRLYGVSFPKTGNILDESDIILKELTARRVISTIPEIIPKLEWDLLMLRSGELFEIDYLGDNEHGFIVRMKDEKHILTIPKNTVESIKSKWGDVIFHAN